MPRTREEAIALLQSRKNQDADMLHAAFFVKKILPSCDGLCKAGFHLRDFRMILRILRKIGKVGYQEAPITGWW